ncbi:hypothetical protein MOW14_14975 (plasmid) [Acinetobacter indicus]|uniref:hypothetical protein n=1 Tax=Acinetobacter indicus TaxID=756892 RepID=UPI001FA814EC|nr:hypothetical protein [Acinetobacter indicus]UNW11132.1 hypothetical protein MOW14_14975 [Acinetobacter indicus]
MNKKIILFVALNCVIAISHAAKDKEKAQPMSEPNPIQAYVNVIPQGGEGRDSGFTLCDHADKSCEKPKRTKKHLAVSSPTIKYPMGTAR